MEVHNRNKGHPRLDVRIKFKRVFGTEFSFEFSYRRKSKLRASREIRDDEGFSHSTFCWQCGLLYGKY